MKKMEKLIKEESGQALVFMALLLTSLVGFVALVVDVGYMYVQKSQLQSASDAAALAGAITMGSAAGQAGVNASVISYLDKNVTGTYQYSAENDLVIDTTNRTVSVALRQVAPKFFAGILSSSTNDVYADATATYEKIWDGEALPFINLDDDYSNENLQIQLWEKLGNGDFESLWKEDYEVVNSGSPNVYFDVDYADGLQITKGVVAEGPEKIKSNVELIMENNPEVYILSLSKEVIASKKYADVKNKLVIDFNDLVLLKVEIVSFEPNGNQPALVLNVKDVYDIAAGDYPVDYNLKNARVKSKLIE